MTRLLLIAHQTLSSTRLLGALAVLWLIAIWSSVLYMSPGTDDAHFILEALGFITHGDIGFLYIQTFREFFLTFPPYAFLHGVFFFVWDGVGLPINYFTYKTFHLFCLMVLILLASMFVYRVPADSRATRVSRTCLILVLLAVAPVTLDIFNPRPETLGLAATVSAMLFFAYGNGAIGSKPWCYGCAGFCVGLAAATHPSFMITSAGLGPVALLLVIRNSAAKAAIGALVLGALPVIAVVTWYLYHYPLSVETLSANVGGRAPTTSSLGVSVLAVLDYILLRLPSGAPLATRLYWGLTFWTFGLLLLASLAILVSDLLQRSRGPLAQLHILLWVFLAMSLVNVLLATSGRVQVYVVASFAAALLVASRYRNHGEADVVTGVDT